MKVLLVTAVNNYKHAYPSFMSSIDFPVGLAYLAASLKAADFEVFGLNPNNKTEYPSAFHMLKGELTQALKSIKPDLIGMGGLCRDYPCLKDAIAIAREVAPKTPIVLGGGIINHDSEFTFQALKPDFCIVGEAEDGLVQLSQTLRDGGNSFDHIPNLGYWKNGAVQFTKQCPVNQDLDKLLFPDYEPFKFSEILEHFSSAIEHPYAYPRLNPRPMPIVAARSCPFTCTFCVHRSGAKYRSRSIDNILKEIAYLYDTYHFNILLLMDELFAVNNKRLKEFSEAILKGKEEHGWDFDWVFQTHASASFNQETLDLAKRAGCYSFNLGLESASPDVLESMNKKTHPSQYLRAIDLADKSKVGFGGNFIFGDTAENGRTIGETMSFFHNHCKRTNISLGSIQPYPGSKLFDHCLEKGIIRSKLDYYENIDTVPFQVNMTSIPDPLWKLWIGVLKYYMLLTPWITCVKAKSCKIIPAEGNPMVSGTGLNFYEIASECPFCGNENRFRPVLNLKATPWPPQTFAHAKKIVKESRLVFWFTFFGIWFLSLWRPLRNFFFYFRMDKNYVYVPSVQTGCKKCNKRYKVDISSGMALPT